MSWKSTKLKHGGVSIFAENVIYILYYGDQEG